MGIFKGVKAAVGGVDKQLIKKGLLARGPVIACAETGFSTGNTPASQKQVCKVTVEVTGVPGHEPYQASCRHPIPVMNIPEMKTPGATVAVRVDAADPQNIALDLASEPPPASDVTTPTVSTTDSASTIDADDAMSDAGRLPTHASPVKSAEVLARGTACRVVILETLPLHQRDRQGLEATGFVLSVFVDSDAPYQAQIGLGVPAAAAALVFPGASLPAKVLQDHPDNPTIDWDAALAASKHPPSGPS